MPTKIGGPFETAKRNLLKDVKGFEKVVYRDGDVQIIVAFGFAQVGGDEAVQNFILRIIGRPIFLYFANYQCYSSSIQRFFNRIHGVGFGFFGEVDVGSSALRGLH